MAGFTSTYLPLAHGAPNWDSQLRADLTSLQTLFAQAGYTPALGGTGAAVGGSANVAGNAQRLGSVVHFNGFLIFGSGASFGSAAAFITGLNALGTLVQNTIEGEGHYQSVNGSFVDTGAPVNLMFQAAGSPNQAYIFRASDGAPAASIVANPPQGSRVVFRISGVLA